jgi:WD40 repeat protein
LATLGPSYRIGSAIYSPDGQTVLVDYVSGWDLWGSTSGALVASGSEHLHTFSPDGRFLIAAGVVFGGDAEAGNEDVGAGIIDTRSGRVQYRLADYTVGFVSQDDLQSASFSEDGLHFVAGGNDGVGRVWDTRTGTVVRLLVGHHGRITYVEYSKDGTRILTVSDDGTARVWDAASGSTLFSLETASAQFSPDGKALIGAVGDQLKVWDAETGQTRAILEEKSPYSPYEFSQDGSTLALFTSDGFSIQLYDTATWQERTTIMARFLSFSVDGVLVATTDSRNVVSIRDAKSGDEIYILRGHTDAIATARFSPDGKGLVTTSADSTTKLWDLSARSEVATLPLPGSTEGVYEAQFSPDGRRVLTVRMDDKVSQYAIDIQDLLDLGTQRATRNFTPQERATYLGDPTPSGTVAPSP